MLKQEEVGRILGLPKDTISRWERGRNEPGFTLISRLSELYKVSLDWLAGHANHPSGLRTGHTIVNVQALQALRHAVKQRQTMGEINCIMRGPGLDIAWDVPDEPMVLPTAEAKALHVECERAVEDLKRNRL